MPRVSRSCPAGGRQVQGHVLLRQLIGEGSAALFPAMTGVDDCKYGLCVPFPERVVHLESVPRQVQRAVTVCSGQSFAEREQWLSAGHRC